MVASILQASTFVFDSTNQASHEVTRPAGLTIGNMLLMIGVCDGGNRVIDMSADGLSHVAATVFNGAGLVNIRVGFLTIDGTEPTTFTVTTSSSETFAAVVYEIENAADPGVSPPTQSAVTGDSATPNPPIHTPAGGADDFLWIGAMAMDIDTTSRTLDSFPANMTAASPAEQAAVGGTTISCGCCADAHASNASSFNPDAFGINESDGWTGLTLNIFPALGGAIVPIVQHHRAMQGVF